LTSMYLTSWGCRVDDLANKVIGYTGDGRCACLLLNVLCWYKAESPPPRRALTTTPPPMAGSWPSDAPCKPSFMVIGTPKSGSSTLYTMLASHDRVQAPARKELCFFSSFKRSRDRGHQTTATDWSLYVKALSAKGSCRGARPFAFEACPFYFGEASAAAAVHSSFPALRAVALLRNPTDRALSEFNAQIRANLVAESQANAGGMLAAFRQMVAMVSTGRRSMEDGDVRMLTQGVYIHGAHAWERQFGGALFVLQTEEVFGRAEVAEAATRRLLAFLGIGGHLPANVVENRNLFKRAASTPQLNSLLDRFYAPYNEQLYAWAQRRGSRLQRWPNATTVVTGRAALGAPRPCNGSRASSGDRYADHVLRFAPANSPARKALCGGQAAGRQLREGRAWQRPAVRLKRES